jgi:sialate O-acetylesterase
MKPFRFVQLSFISALCAILFSCENADKGTLKPSLLFSDHMVLKQQTDVAIWGHYVPNQQVTLSGSWGSTAEATTDENGRWQASLSTPEAGGPYELSINAKDSTIVFSDVMIGEVWLASGQSNMEMPLRGWPPNDTINYSAKEIANASYPGIRMFTVQRSFSASPLDSLTGSWLVSSPETAANFSATAYFFARRLHRELSIPIGIIHSSWGGTPAESWTSKEKLRTLGDFNTALDDLNSNEDQQTISEWFGKWKTTALPQTEAIWKQLSFADEAAADLGFDDQSWPEIDLPGRFDVFDSGEIDGAVWFRKKINITDLSQDYVLAIGAVDDMDATFVNGQKVGGLAGPGYYNVAREFTVPRSILKQGENVIAIRAVDTGGPGEINGTIALMNMAGTRLDLTGPWKYKPVAEIYQGAFYNYGLGPDGFDTRPKITDFNQNMPSVLYNAMIEPLIPYTINGAIWYQGESNVGRAAQYEKLFPAMISDWRERWGEDFPFYFVQIAPYQYHGGPPQNDVSQKLRDAQRKSLALPNTGMVVTMDIGNFTNIHPGNKQDVGVRLAGLALANDYGKELVASGPLYKSHRIEGNKIIVEFDHAGSGLVWKNPKLTNFEIAGADKKFVPASFRIVGDQVEVFKSSVYDPMYVRYAWSDRGLANLFNKEGLPASSFSTEE